MQTPQSPLFVQESNAKPTCCEYHPFSLLVFKYCLSGIFPVYPPSQSMLNLELLLTVLCLASHRPTTTPQSATNDV